MASFTPPPSSQLQPFSVPAPEYQDPLESLAKLRQNRLQNMQVQQAQLKMQSQRGLMQAMAQAGNKPDELMKIATARGDILPEDLVTLQNHMLETQTKLSNLDEQKRKQLIFDTDMYAGLMQGVTTKEGVAAANAKAAKMNLFRSKQFDPIDPESLDPDTFADSLTAHVNAYLGQSGIAKRLQDQAQLAQTQASAASSEQGAITSRLAGEKTSQEIKDKRRDEMIQAIRSAPTDPKTGTPTPAAWVSILREYKDQKLPETPTKEYISGLVESKIPPEKLPEYRRDLANKPKTAVDLAIIAADPTQPEGTRDQANKALVALRSQQGGTNTETELAIAATDPKNPPEVRRAAELALKRLAQAKREGSPTMTFQLPGLGAGQQAGAAAQLTGDEFLKSLPPGTSAQIRAIADGRATMPSPNTRQPAAMALRDAVFKYDPTWSEQRAQLRKAFTTGPDGRNIGNLSTAVVHLGQFYDAAMALANGQWQPGNSAWNYWRTIFGSKLPTNFESLKTAVAGEMANALKGQATDPEIAHIMATFQTAESAEQLAGVVETNLHTLGAKLRTYMERVQREGDLGNWSPLLPSAKAVYDRFGMDPMAPEQSGGGHAGAPVTPPGGAGAGGGRIIVIAKDKDGNDKEYPMVSEAAARAFEAGAKAAKIATRRK